MKASVCAVLLGLLCLSGSALTKEAPPKVQVYSRTPGEFGKSNTFICHVSGFHPPEITIELLRNDEEMPNAKQTELAFESSWHYHLTKHAPFTPNKGEKYTCRVTHMGKAKVFEMDADI